jgi:hypothetical protein
MSEGTAGGDSDGRQQGCRVRPEELRWQFQNQGGSALGADRGRVVRQARRMYFLFAVGVAVVCVVLMVVRIAAGDGVGHWLAFYAGGVAGGALGAVLARRGRTRWAMAAAMVGVICATSGDNPTVA